MAISRRNLLKFSSFSAAALALGGTLEARAETPDMIGLSNGKRVVIVGAGFGGLSVAKELRKADKSIEVVVLEKRDVFMSCPYSNGWLGGLCDPSGKNPITLDTLTFDYFAPAIKYNYRFIQTTVVGVNRESKTVSTTNGSVKYDYLVVTGGIEYDYSKLFGDDTQAAQRCLMDCPPALKPGSEHVRLKKQLMEMEDGNFVIAVPEGSYRCPPAPYERAAMVANFIKTNKLKAKVLILDPRPMPVAKAKQFSEVYKGLYPDIIEYHKNTFLKSVDIDGKKVQVETVDGAERIVREIKYSVANIIPRNVASPLMKMAGVKTNADGYALISLPMHAALNKDGTATDDLYVLGDAVAAVNFAAGSAYPKSGYMANSQGKIVAKQLLFAMGLSKNDGLSLPDNICYSMVQGNPREAIVVNHKVEFIMEKTKDVDGKEVEVRKIKVTPTARGENQADRSAIAKSTDEWFKAIMRELFA